MTPSDSSANALLETYVPTSDRRPLPPPVVENKHSTAALTRALAGGDSDNILPSNLRLITDTSDPKIQLVATLLAQGKSKREISKLLGVSYSTVITFAAQPITKRLVRELLEKHGGNSIKTFLSTQVMDSLETLVEIRDNSEARPSDRAAAANAILDRALGKPTQHIETHEGTVENATLEIAELQAKIAATDSRLRAAGVSVN